MWLIHPSISSVFAPGSLVSILAFSSHCPDAGLWATLNGKPTRRLFSWPGWSKRSWTRHLFGAATLPSSTAARGVDSWISSLGATRASLLALPASAVGQAIRDTYGPSVLASLKNRSPASVTSRTSADTLGSALTLFGMTFEGWAIELRRDCLRRRKSARRTRGKGCSSSLWPTARAEDSASCGNHPDATDSLTGITKQWTTPRTITGGGESGERKKALGRTESGGGGLQAQATNWHTPTANDDNKSAEAHLAMKARMKGGARKAITSLAVEVKVWPTPKSRDTKGQSQRGQHGLKDALPNMAESFPPDPATATDGHDCSPKCRRLNPRFVAWLMGLPPDWTSCDASGTRWSLWKQRMRSCLFGLVS